MADELIFVGAGVGAGALCVGLALIGMSRRSMVFLLAALPLIGVFVFGLSYPDSTGLPLRLLGAFVSLIACTAVGVGVCVCSIPLLRRAFDSSDRELIKIVLTNLTAGAAGAVAATPGRFLSGFLLATGFVAGCLLVYSLMRRSAALSRRLAQLALIALLTTAGAAAGGALGIAFSPW
ncbi:MAG: hypothetical protein JXR96_11055 [Deltaproteobacteria bacterium]|nr:hypothetical protein [Deltaproteobacteria bacterium]